MFFYLSTLGLLASLISCSWFTESKKEHSILVVAVEILPQEAVLCTESLGSEGSVSGNSTEEISGFQTLCKESVRFTHAFTPSTMSQAALTSIFTGQWPFQHGVRHNGSQFLPPRYQTIAEVADQQHYRTSFFSGGPPIWHKSGLGQGFDLFEDAVPVSRDQLHRPFQETTNEFLNWVSKDSIPYFSVIYVPDLQTFDLPALDHLGHPTDRSYEGQVKQLDHSLGVLIQELKKQKSWDNLYFVLVGLNGRSSAERVNELSGSNLHIENTQVALMIKPPQKIRDEAMHWKIDSNVSLVDLGRTLFDIFDSKGVLPGDVQFKSASLASALAAPREDWARDRPIPIESGWASWHHFGNLRFALRTSNSLYLMNKRIESFSTLSDRLETSPQGVDSKFRQLQTNLPEFPALGPWQLDRNPGSLIDVAINLWSPSSSLGVVDIEFIKEKRVLGWLALKAIKEQNWKELLKLSSLSKDPSWEYLAASRLGRKASTPSDDCFKLIEDKVVTLKTEYLKGCDDLLTKSLFQLITAESGGGDSSNSREGLLRYYDQLLLDRRIMQLNVINGMTWDVNLEKLLSPTIGEILLHLPGQQKYFSMVQERE